VIERFARFPAYLAERSKSVRLAGEIPALLAHPDWERPAPTVIWLHGRTVSKELDPGRYLRWVRAGIAACAIDLPGHGERLDERLRQPAHTLEVLAQTIGEIDRIVAALGEPPLRGRFDLDRLGIGGMSAGGMAALRRLCDPHPFRCAAVEGTTGNFDELYFGSARRSAHDPARVARLDPMKHLDGWRPIPFLVIHSQADRVIPFAGMAAFIERLREHYLSRGADPALIEVLTWPETGAPEEHAGFGRYSNEAKNAQTEFFRKHLAA
jgi:alpha-beta hydrolase superfamily lysophospholipase